MFSVDVEDYFQVEAFASHIRYEQWNTFTPRVERNVVRILELMDIYKAKGTFFVLGWVAERFPNLIRQIAQAGHEIGCHSHEHKRIHVLSPEGFRSDLRQAKSLLEDQVQQPVRCYRAPSFSVVSQTMWALDVLAEEGITVDSSIFPIVHDIYGVPGVKRFPYWHTTAAGSKIFEFPPSTLRYGDKNFPVAGGGYLRLLPYATTRWAIRQLNLKEKQPAMVYLHPWEIDPGQPRIRSGLKSRFRHYVNLSRMESKIENLLKDFSFTTLAEACLQQRDYATSADLAPNRVAAAHVSGTTRVI